MHNKKEEEQQIHHLVLCKTFVRKLDAQRASAHGKQKLIFGRPLCVCVREEIENDGSFESRTDEVGCLAGRAGS